MLFLISETNDPYFNLATEEFLLKDLDDDILFIYSNNPCVIVGKHQNALAEVNYRFLIENNIPLIRRISGGGTVYHDLGNINFSFFKNGVEGNLVNFRSFIEPVADFLAKTGISVDIGKRNDMLVNGLKVSGNAEHIFKKRTLHHGTLLFNSQLNNLRNALKTVPGKYTDRAVKSVRSSVANLSEFIQEQITIDTFNLGLSQHLCQIFNTTPISLDQNTTSSIKKSINTKYSQWDWNYGYSPAYTFQVNVPIETYSISIDLKVEHGLIQEVHIDGDLPQKTKHLLEKSLINLPHHFEKVDQIINLSEINFPLDKKTELAWAFF